MGRKARRIAQKMSWDKHLDRLEEVLVQAAKLQGTLAPRLPRSAP